MINAVTYLSEHAKVLREGGAPHQQPLAAAIEEVLNEAPAVAAVDTTEFDNLKAQVATLQTELADSNDKVTNLQGNLDNLLRVRDDLQAQLEKAMADLHAAKAANTELEAKLARGPLSVAADPVGGRGVYDPSTSAVAADGAARPLVFDPVTGAVQSVG